MSCLIGLWRLALALLLVATAALPAEAT